MYKRKFKEIILRTSLLIKRENESGNAINTHILRTVVVRFPTLNIVEK